MKQTIRLKEIHWGDGWLCYYSGNSEQPNGLPVYPGIDGSVEYEVTFENTPEEMASDPELKNRINPYSYTINQPFTAKGSSKMEYGYVWAWDGNKEAPTLTPSFLSDAMDLSYRPHKIHLYFSKGKIQLLGDSTVKLDG